MKTLFFLEAMCGTHRKIFYPRYDYAADDVWALTYGVTSLPKGAVVEPSVGEVNVKYYRTGPQYKCPWCGNTSYLLCRTCRKITCYDGVSKEFTCVHCGTHGKVGGQMTGKDVADSITRSGDGQ